MSKFEKIIKESLTKTNLKMIRVKKDPRQCNTQRGLVSSEPYTGYILEEDEDGRVVAYIHDKIRVLEAGEYQLYSEDDILPSIGFFPGGFKPPTGFHYNALLGSLGKATGVLVSGQPSDFIHVIIGHSPRGRKSQNDQLAKVKLSINSIKKRKDFTGDKNQLFKIKNRKTGEVKNSSIESLEEELLTLSSKMIDVVASKNIWELYVKDINTVVDVNISRDASPVKGMESMILGLTSEELMGNVINLYAGKEDRARFEYYTSDRFKQELMNTGKIESVDDIDIRVCELSRMGSATDVRNAIRDVVEGVRTIDTLKQYIPQHVDVNVFFKQLNQFTKR